MDLQLVQSSLDSLLADGYISEVVRVIKSGKEGTVYCCRGGPLAERDLVAAKIYHPLERRAFRNDAVYQGGRLRGPGTARGNRALARKTGFGREMQLATWVGSEYETMRILHGAGADVPAPIARGPNAVAMEYLGDADSPAPPLIGVRLGREEAPVLMRQVMRNVALMLRCDRIHGDLSPYNILYWRGAITIIDFPQAVDPRFNPNARALLERDVANVAGFFQRFGVGADPVRLARRMWDAYRHGASLE